MSPAPSEEGADATQLQVFCTHTEPNFSLPWQRKRQYQSNSSGFVIGGRRLLTNAHSVEHHTQVRHWQRSQRAAAVEVRGRMCAILAMRGALRCGRAGGWWGAASLGRRRGLDHVF